MRTTGDANGNTWTCAGPNQFDEAIVKAHNSLESSSCKACLELYENEMEKWGCNALGEEFGGQRKPKPKGYYFWYVPRDFERLALLVCLNLHLCACD